MYQSRYGKPLPYGQPNIHNPYMQQLRDDRHHLTHENQLLANENNNLKQTMKVRATSQVITRHKNSKYPQYGNLHITPRKREIRCYFGAGSQ